MADQQDRRILKSLKFLNTSLEEFELGGSEAHREIAGELEALRRHLGDLTQPDNETSNNVHAYFPKLPFPSAMHLPPLSAAAAQALQLTQVNNTVEAARAAITAAQSRMNPSATPTRLEPMNMEGQLPYGTSCPAPEGRPRPSMPGPKPKPKPDTGSVEAEPRRRPRRATASIIVMDSEEEDNSEDDYIPSPSPERHPREELEEIEQPPAKKKKQTTKTLAPKKQYNTIAIEVPKTRKPTSSAISQAVAPAEAAAGAAEARSAQIFTDASFIISLAALQADLYDRTVRARMEQRAHYCNFQAQYPDLVNPWEGMVGIELPDDLQIMDHNLTPYLAVLHNALTSIQSRMYSQ